MSAITDIDTFLNDQPTCDAIEALLRERSYAYLDTVGAQPLAPTLRSLKPSAEDLAAYQRALAEFEVERAAQAERERQYRHENERLMDHWHQTMRNEFCALAPEFAAMSHALFNACYDAAYDRHHSGGLGEVRNGLVGVAEFALRAIKAAGE